MPSTMRELGIECWNFEDRLALAEEIWASVHQELDEIPLSDGQRQELERRLADSIARPEAVVPWEEVKAKALARSRR